MAQLARILRFPLKSLSAEDLERVTLVAGHGLPGDRRFALLQAGQSVPTQPGWLPPEHLVTLTRFPRLAQLDSRVDGQRLTIRRRGRVVVSADLGSPHGRAVISAFFAAFLAGDSFGHPHVVECADGFGDSPRPRLSIIGAASLAELQRISGRPMDPAALRINLVVSHLPPRAEQQWIGHRLHLGNTVLRVTEAMDRPILPELLRNTFGHAQLGLWADILTGGTIQLGDEIILPALASATMHRLM